MNNAKTWAKCPCGLEMRPGGRCAITHEADGTPRRKNLESDPGTTCHDCNAAFGALHHLGCDMERCAYCGSGQAIGCDCEGYQTMIANLKPEEAE